MQSTAYSADKIFDGEKWLNDHVIIVKDSTIQAVAPASEYPDSEINFFKDHFIAPAYIDIQIYGAHGKLLAVYPEASSLHLLYDYCFAGGATLLLPTVATNTKEVFFKTIDAVKDYWKEGGMGVHGLHLEGPWLNKQKRGAHAEDLIHSPSINEVEELLTYGNGIIKMITLAPEVCDDKVIELIQSKGIIISAGHSNATFEQGMNAFNKGIKAVTHLYNAMSGLHHREPGLVGAAFMHNSVKASIIADGHHVDFQAIKIAKEIMKERLFIITDAVTETSAGYYKHQLAEDKYECNETLSGSAITMHQSFINLVTKAGIDVDEALRMCSYYPAQVLQCDDEYGKIAPGYKAQFLVIDHQLNLSKVINL